MTKSAHNAPLPVLSPGVALLDTHCHLDFPDYQADLPEVLARARAAGVGRTITVGIDLPTSRAAIALAGQHPELFATVGVHPHHVKELGEADYALLRELARHPRVVGYGEIGLDYVKDYSPVAVQREHFVRQVALGRELDLPLIIHDREAHADTIAILREALPLPAGGVMHCFSGDAAFAEEVLAVGFYLSIPGVVTFPKAEAMQEVARQVPLDRLLLETDGPFLAPVPRRGKRNEPQLLLHTAQRVAELKGVSLDEVARATTANAEHLFRLEGRGHVDP